MRFLAPRVKETTTTTGTGTLDLAGAVASFQLFVAGIGHLKQCYYTLLEGNNWEVGIGTVTDAATDTLSRDRILASSNAGAALNLSAGTKDVFCDGPAEAFSEVSWGSRGNVSKNNAGTPNTQFDLIAKAVTLRDAYGKTITVENPSIITCNILTAGPAANGRDQAGAFSASSWIYFYWIAKVVGSTITLASIASTVETPTGPTLPTDYTYWGLCTDARLDASTNLLKIRVKGAWAFYEAAQNVLSTSTYPTTETTLSVSTVVPPGALEFQLHWRGKIINGQAAANETTFYNRFIAGNEFARQDIFAIGNGSSGADKLRMWLRFPNVSQQLFYFWGSVVGWTGDSYQADVVGFKNPNGGE